MSEANITELSSGSYKYVRRSFYEAGQDSYSDPLAQNPDLFEALENVLSPVGTGVLNRRWGYDLFNNPAQTIRRLYEFQRDSDSSRRIVATNSGLVLAVNENGTTYAPAIFYPGATAGHPRMVSSRDWAFFVDGLSADLLKWGGYEGPIHQTYLDINGQPNYIGIPHHANYAAASITVEGWFQARTSNPADTEAIVFKAANSTAGNVEFGLYYALNGHLVLRADNVTTGFTNTGTNVWTDGLWHHAAIVRVDGTDDVVTLYVDGVQDAQVTVTGGVNTNTNEIVLGKFTSVSSSGRHWQNGLADFRFWNTNRSQTQIQDNMRKVLTGSETNLVGYWRINERTGNTLDDLTSTNNNGTNNGGTWVTETGGLWKWGISAPATAISVGAPVSGSVTLEDGRKYFLIFRNSETGHNSGLSPVSAETGPVTAKDIPLSNIEVSTDKQVDRKLVLATADGGDETTLFFLADIPNTQTTLTDNIPEATLLAANVYLETDDFGIEHGVADNDPPANMTLPTKHKGRIYGVVGQFLRFSKSLDDLTTSTGIITGRYEEAWPATYELDISEGAETVKALLSDGEVLWIGTERHVRRLLGDGPNNFVLPEIAFNEVGVLNQETWKAVLLEGQPIGVMWLTPDFKVMGSDFNTYQDVGTPIQDILDSINSASATKASAAYVADGAYNLYVLAIPTGANTEPDTLCVYDLKLRRWYVWKLADKVTAQLWNIPASGVPQAIFGADTSKLYKFNPASTQDRVGDTPVSFTALARTVWLDLGDPLTRKNLNEVEVIGDNALTVDVDGATKYSEFATPASIVTSQALTLGPLDDYKVFLAGLVTKDRFYRFKFSSTAANNPLLAGFSVEVIPVHQL